MQHHAVPITTPRPPVVPERIPHRAGRPHGTGKYPFDKLTEVGQSFFVPVSELPKGSANAIRKLATGWARRRGLKYHPFDTEVFPMGVRVTRASVGDERGNRGRKYPWSTTPVGQSFFVDSRLFGSKPGIEALHAALWHWKRNRPERAHITYRGKTLKNGVLMTRTA